MDKKTISPPKAGSGTAPPSISAADRAKLNNKSSTTGEVTDLYNLNVSGFGNLSNSVIQGASDFFGFSQASASPLGEALGFPRTPQRPMTATDVMTAFSHLSGAKLADAQDKLYRGGYYSSSNLPNYGKLNAQDISAFRTFLIGLAANPAQGDLNTFLTGVAQDGDASGLNLKKRAPLIVRLTSPTDLRIVLQKTAQDLYGGNLPEDDVQKFISSFNNIESQYQSQVYQQGESPSSGVPQVDPTTGAYTGAGGTVIQPPAASSLAEEQIRAKHPLEVATQGFVNAMDNVLGTFTRTPPGANR